jgi:hypothetical protein
VHIDSSCKFFDGSARRAATIRIVRFAFGVARVAMMRDGSTRQYRNTEDFDVGLALTSGVQRFPYLFSAFSVA